MKVFENYKETQVIASPFFSRVVYMAMLVMFLAFLAKIRKAKEVEHRQIEKEGLYLVATVLLFLVFLLGFKTAYLQLTSFSMHYHLWFVALVAVMLAIERWIKKVYEKNGKTLG